MADYYKFCIDCKKEDVINFSRYIVPEHDKAFDCINSKVNKLGVCQKHYDERPQRIKELAKKI